MRDPAIGEILVQADDLQHRVRELGADISRDYAGRNLVLVGVLKGAVFFLSDLMRQIEIPNRFAIGYGLDHAERYRNLPYVAALAETSSQSDSAPRT